MEQVIEVRDRLGEGATKRSDALLRAILTSNEEESLDIGWPTSLGDHLQTVFGFEVLTIT